MADNQDTATAQTRTHADTVRASFAAWQNRDWNALRSILADGFTFTTQYDDHIHLPEYKTKCWDVVQNIDPFEILTLIEQDAQVVVRYKGRINGMDVQNMEHFKFQNDKIKSVDVFFGRPDA